MKHLLRLGRLSRKLHFYSCSVIPVVISDSFESPSPGILDSCDPGTNASRSLLFAHTRSRTWCAVRRQLWPVALLHQDPRGATSRCIMGNGQGPKSSLSNDLFYVLLFCATKGILLMRHLKKTVPSVVSLLFWDAWKQRSPACLIVGHRIMDYEEITIGTGTAVIR